MLHSRTEESFAITRRKRCGTKAGFGTSIAAPSTEILRITQLMTEPPADTYAGSLISVRGCFRLSSMDFGLAGAAQVATLAQIPKQIRICLPLCTISVAGRVGPHQFSATMIPHNLRWTASGGSSRFGIHTLPFATSTA
jgi:hypothetical protein